MGKKEQDTKPLFKEPEPTVNLSNSVASIYLPEGVNVNVAKIEGSPAYKQVMRKRGANKDSVINNIQTSLSVQSLREYLPPWLGGHDYSHETLSWMLKALKAASESYLEVPVPTAEITTPFPITKPFFDTLRSIAKSLSIQMYQTPAPPGGRLAALFVYGIGPGVCDDLLMLNEPAQLFLTVEYTRAALTALLVVEECGIYDTVRVLHETDLGADRLTGPNRQTKLADALRGFTQLRVEDYWQDLESLKSLSNVVLLGESAADPLLHDVLKDVLSKQQQKTDFLLADAGDRRKRPIDPVFTPSMGAAHLDFFRSGPGSGDNEL